jgi:hypothetical protein
MSEPDCTSCADQPKRAGRRISIAELVAKPVDPFDAATRHAQLCARYLQAAKVDDDSGLWRDLAMSNGVALLHYLRHVCGCGQMSLDAMAESFAAVGDLDVWSWDVPQPKPRKRKSIKANLRWRVLSRDQFRCTACGAKPPEVALQLDHITPHSKGGRDHISNLRTLCEQCNVGRGDAT